MDTNQHPSRPTSARPPGVPSRRVVGALVVCSLALGVLIGASIAPAPPSSLASEGSTLLSRMLALLAAEGGPRPTVSATPEPAASASASSNAPTVTPAALRGAAERSQTAPAVAQTTPGPASRGERPSKESTGSGKSVSSEKKPRRLPPISHVWLVVVNGTGFSAIAATPSDYPYLTGTLLKQGILLKSYSAIEAYELAGDAVLLTGGIGQSVSTISQPVEEPQPKRPIGQPKPERPAGESQPAGEAQPAGASPPAAEPAEGADAFLQRAVAPILASSAYRERGLVVVTFGSAAQEQGLGLTMLGSTPSPAGALLLSPTLKASGHSPETFDSLAPRQSLEAIFAA